MHLVLTISRVQIETHNAIALPSAEPQARLDFLSALAITPPFIVASSFAWAVFLHSHVNTLGFMTSHVGVLPAGEAFVLGRERL